MPIRRIRQQLGRVAASAAAAVTLLVAFTGLALGGTAQPRHSAPTAGAQSSAAAPAWTGTFDNFHTQPWIQHWGTTSDTQQCQGASGSFTCNWGYSNMQPVSDPTAPGGGQALNVTYPAPSGPPSCHCGLGGGQFYQDLTTNGEQALAGSPTLDLKYYYKFPVGFDFGKKTAGKMPGLWGGGVPGCESGAQHCAQGWSTRYMWRGGSSSAPSGELYFYTASGSGFGADLCLGNWTFPADGKWHSIEQLTNVQTGDITVWSDGKSVCQVNEPLPGAHSGVFFSTFHGGHDTSWSPSHTTTDEFADFTLATGQQTGGNTSPAVPTNPSVTGTTSSSISLSWTETNNSDPAVSYKVYEGGTVVASPTTTSATISGLAAGSTHTYTVTAVDSAGVESAKSASVSGATSGGATSPAVPTNPSVTGTTSSSISLSWTETNNSDPAVSYKVYEAGAVVATSTTTSATVSGLAAGSTHTYAVTAVDANGVESAQSASVTGSTSGGGGGGLTIKIVKTKDWGSGYTDTATITNNSGAVVNGWNVQFDLDPSMDVESSANATYTSSGHHFTLTNTSSDATIPNGGSQSFQFSGDYSTKYIAPANVTVNGQGSGPTTPAVPTGLTVSGTTSSSISLSWTENNNADPAASYKVYEGTTVVATPTTTSATVSGLAASSSHTYSVTAVDSAGNESGRSATVTGTTGPGGPTSPAVPAGLTVSGTTSSSISLSWTENDNADPAASYKVYEGTTVVATPTTTSATISGLAPNSTHTYAVSAVDSAGNESAQSTSVTAATQQSNTSKFSQADIDNAVAAPLIAFAAPTSSVPRPGTNPVNIGSAKVLQYLALVDQQVPGTKATNGTTVESALLAQVHNLIAGGNEPDADGGLEGWAHAPVAEGLLLLKNGSAWSQLSAADQNKVTLLEAALGYAGNYTYNDANNFSSGICGFGNFSKTNNPNYRDGYVDVEMASIEFFGTSKWDSMLTAFDDSTEVSQLNGLGLTNAGGCYQTVGSGANSAIKRPFVYSGVHSTDLLGLWNVLAADTFDQTVTSVNGPAHIADGTTSPFQGQFGMGHEFNSTDSQGLRSSALYTFEGWMNVTGSRLSLSALGGWTCGAATSAARYKVGSGDLIYKLHHGYISHALNQNDILVDDAGHPPTDGPNVKGYQYDLDAYNVMIATQSC